MSPKTGWFYLLNYTPTGWVITDREADWAKSRWFARSLNGLYLLVPQDGRVFQIGARVSPRIILGV